jgi:hypothetical protein
MFAGCVRGLLLLCLGSAIVGCSNSGLDSVQVSPSAQSLAVGQTAQLTATGTFGNSKHASTQVITSGVTWSSSAPAVATVNAAGLVTAVSAGTTTVTASAAAFNGPTSSSATISVTGSSGSQASANIVSLSIIPGVQSVASPSQTSQFLAIGTTSSGATVNLTNQVVWGSSSTQIATIGTSTGLATAISKGTATITALYTSPTGGTVVTGTGTFTVVGGTTQQFTALTILPNAQTLSTLNQTAQFIALATSGTTGLQQDMTNSPQLKWSSSLPAAGSISATGVAKNLAAGNSLITAQLTNSDGSVVTGTAALTTALTAAPQDLLSLTIVPNSIGVGNLNATGQFLAIGTFATPPYVRDLTNSATWITSAPNVFPVTTNSSAAPTSGSQNGGVVSAWGTGGAAIIAEAKGSDGTIQTATATFNCPLVIPNPGSPATATTPATPATPGSCYPGSQASALLSTLTVYNEGLNTNTAQNWQVTAPSVSTPPTPNVLHCGPGWTGTGGSVCTATYPVGSIVTLTVPATDPATGAKFGGWSSNCMQTTPVIPSEHGLNQCTILLTSDDTVGVIFN